ncbi:MAG: hypothetical protein WBZ30_09400, partial [Bradyrhizobium sp.]
IDWGADLIPRHGDSSRDRARRRKAADYLQAGLVLAAYFAIFYRPIRQSIPGGGPIMKRRRRFSQT